VTAISVCVAAVRPATVAATVRSILRQSWPDWELIVVGQGERAPLEGAVRGAAGADARVRYVHAARAGTSAARNAGYALASGEVVATTDDDCEAQEDWLAVVAAAFAQDPGLGVVGGSLLAPPGPAGRGPSSCLALVPEEVLYDPARTPPPAPAGFNWVGANCAVRRSVARRVGRLDELLGPGAPFRSGEDLDYLHRLEAAGVRMLSTPRSAVRHTHGRRSGLRSVARYWYGQGAGHGAVLAKRTLAGDPRGRAELVRLLGSYPHRALARAGPGDGPAAGRRAYGRLASDAVRLPALAAAYRRCLRDFRLDEEGLLRPRARSAAA